MDTALGELLRTAFWPFGYEAAATTLTREHLGEPQYESVSLSRLMMDETRRICELRLASIRGLEQKATSQIATAGIILAILAAVGGSLALRTIPMVLLVIAVLALIKAGYVRSGSLPSFGDYLSEPVMGEPQNEARIALLAAGAWQKYGLELEAANRVKTRYVRTGAFWLVAAIVAILLVVFWAAAASLASDRTGHATMCLQSCAKERTKMFDEEKPPETPAPPPNPTGAVPGGFNGVPATP